MPEQQNIEYKQSWHDDYLKWVDCSPCGLSLEDLKSEHNSRPRNPLIAKACFMAGYIDAWGRGTLKIYDSCKAHGLPEPEIVEKDGGLLVTLYKTAQVTDEGGATGGATGGAIGGAIEARIAKIKEDFGSIEERLKYGIEDNINYFRIVSEPVFEYLSDEFGIDSEKLQVSFGLTSGKIQERFRIDSGKPLPNWFLILALIAVYPEIIASEIAKIIGLSERSVYKNLNELREKKLIQRIGGRKEGNWELKKQ